MPLAGGWKLLPASAALQEGGRGGGGPGDQLGARIAVNSQRCDLQTAASKVFIERERAKEAG